jgi:hypothetical protein
LAVQASGEQQTDFLGTKKEYKRIIDLLTKVKEGDIPNDFDAQYPKGPINE